MHKLLIKMLLALSVSVFYAGPEVFCEELVIDGAVAIVGTEVITHSELNEAIDLYLDEAGIGNVEILGAERLAKLKESALDELIRIMLLYQKAVSQGLIISRERVESYIYEDLRKKKERIGTDEEFLEFLKRENVTLDELKDELSQQQIRQVTAKLYLEREFLENIEISEESRQAALRENQGLAELKDVAKIRQIYIVFNPDDTADKERAFKRAEEVLEKARGNEDFGKLILEYSDDPNVKSTGGIMNQIHPGMLFSEIDKAVFELDLMKVSGIIEGPRGYHIIQVLDRLLAEEQIDNFIKNSDVEKYIEELKSEFPVYISKTYQ